jgi:hypothetical protein
MSFCSLPFSTRVTRIALTGWLCAGLVLNLALLAVASADENSGSKSESEHSSSSESQSSGSNGQGPDNSGSHQQPVQSIPFSEQDLAREAVANGLVKSLGEVLPAVTEAVHGDILEVHLMKEKSGNWIYKFVILSADSRYLSVFVDARRNVILKIR